MPRPSAATQISSAIDKFDKTFEKSFGEGTLSSGGKVAPYKVISTGSLELDLAMGIGGYP